MEREGRKRKRAKEHEQVKTSKAARHEGQADISTDPNRKRFACEWEDLPVEMMERILLSLHFEGWPIVMVGGSCVDNGGTSFHFLPQRTRKPLLIPLHFMAVSPCFNGQGKKDALLITLIQIRSVTTFAARNGQLHVLEWLKEIGCRWDVYTSAKAAVNGHLQTLKWLREQGCTWDKRTCKAAAGQGDLMC